MKKKVIAVVAIVLIFAIAVVIGINFNKKQSKNNKQSNSGQATSTYNGKLPGIDLYYGSQKVGSLNGYTMDMEEEHMRDVIVPVNTDRTVPITISTNGNKVSEISYEMKSTEDNRLIDNGTLDGWKQKDGKITLDYQASAIMEQGTEYFWEIIIKTDKYEQINYYARVMVTDKEFEIWQSMAKGIQEGNGGTQLMSYHPTGEISSHYWFHNESWLSFNILQSGHYRRMDPVYRFSGMYAQLNPIKPFVNAEPSYEDIPVRFWEYFDYAKFGKKKEDIIGDNGLIKDTTYFTDGIYDDYDIRMQAYWTYLSGAAGYTYGNNAIWQMYKPGGKYHVPCLSFWDGALDRPGAECMRYVKSLFTMYPLDRFRPDLSVLFGINYNDASYITPVLAKDKTFILVYLSQGQDVRIQMSKLRSLGKAYWFNPRNGARTLIGPVENKGIRTFNAPGEAGERGNDWILILEADDR